MGRTAVELDVVAYLQHGFPLKDVAIIHQPARDARYVLAGPHLLELPRQQRGGGGRCAARVARMAHSVFPGASLRCTTSGQLPFGSLGHRARSRKGERGRRLASSASAVESGSVWGRGSLRPGAPPSIGGATCAAARFYLGAILQRGRETLGCRGNNNGSGQRGILD